MACIVLAESVVRISVLQQQIRARRGDSVGQQFLDNVVIDHRVDLLRIDSAIVSKDYAGRADMCRPARHRPENRTPSSGSYALVTAMVTEILGLQAKPTRGDAADALAFVITIATTEIGGLCAPTGKPMRLTAHSVNMLEITGFRCRRSAPRCRR